jgi:hypothetical protein
MNDPVDPNITELLRHDFDLPKGGLLTEAELLKWLTQRVEDLIRTRPAYLSSLCYTLDLAEADVATALGSPSPAAPPENLARLLYERQCARALTKNRYRPPTLEDEDAW